MFGHEFEHFQSISEAVLKKCPKCGKLKLRRLFGTGAAVVFKGSGFYQTDYRSENYKKAAEKDGGQKAKQAIKCDMCSGIDGGPACVRACPTGAAIRVSPDKFLTFAKLTEDVE